MKITVYVNADGSISARFPKGYIPERADFEYLSAVIKRYKTKAA